MPNQIAAIAERQIATFARAEARRARSLRERDDHAGAEAIVQAAAAQVAEIRRRVQAAGPLEHRA